MYSITLPPGEYPIYLRKSRADMDAERRGHFETLAKHETALHRLAETLDLTVGQIYREIVSGESVAARTEFRALMAKVQQRSVPGILVYDLQRLGRGDMMEYGWILSTLQYTGTLIITPMRVFNPADDMDMQYLQQQMLSGNTELSWIKRRLKEGHESATRRGEFVGNQVPFGYSKMQRDDGLKTLAPNDDAPLVQMIFQSVADGEGAASIARRLNRSGIRTVRDSEWQPKRINLMIENPVYKGYVTWNKYITVVNDRIGLEYVKKRVKNPDYIIEKGLHEPIVSEELWDAANARKRPYHRAHKDRILRNPLAGLLKCRSCGAPMVYNQALRGQAYYRHKPYTACTCDSSKVTDVIDALCNALDRVSSDISAMASEIKRESDLRESEIAALEKERVQLTKKRDKLIELYTSDAITLDEFQDRRSSWDERLKDIETRVLSLETYIPPDPEKIVVSVRRLLDDIQDGVSPEQINSALKGIVERIEYSKDNELHLHIRLKDLYVSSVV